jgi:Chaperone of endosialidase
LLGKSNIAKSGRFLWTAQVYTFFRYFSRIIVKKMNYFMKRKYILFVFLVLIFEINTSQAQNVGIGTTTPHASAALDISSTNKGVLIPRVSFADRPASPVAGLLIYQTDADAGFYYYNGSNWLLLGNGTVNGTSGQIGYFNASSSLTSSSGLQWDNSLGRLRVNGLNDGAPASGFTNWISASFGGSGGNRVVTGVQNGEATIGAHNSGLSAWAKLVINPAGTTAIGSLAGTGTRMVVANANGDLAAQAIPVADNLGDHTATQNINLNNRWLSNTAGNSGIRIDSTGKVGVGTDTTHGALQFSNAPNKRKIVFGEDENNDNRVYAIGTDINMLRYNIPSFGTAHVFTAGRSSTASEELMRITSEGRVGIGSSNPIANFEVMSLGNFGVQVYPAPIVRTVRGTSYAGQFNFGQGFGELSFDISNDLFASSTNEYYFGTSQNSNAFRPGTDNTKSLGTPSTRWTTVFATNGTINTSDSAEKKNIRNLDYGLQEVLKMRPVMYNWKSDEGNDDKVGLIAQEVQRLIPEAVKRGGQLVPKTITDETGKLVPNPNYSNRLGIYYSDLIPVLIKAVQEQQAIINSQKTVIENMEKRLQKLEGKQ